MKEKSQEKEPRGADRSPPPPLTLHRDHFIRDLMWWDGLRFWHRDVPKCRCRKSHKGERSMEKITTIGLHIARI